MTDRDPADMGTEELLSTLLEKTEHRAQPYLSEVRKEQLTLEINRLLFHYKYENGEFDVPA